MHTNNNGNVGRMNRTTRNVCYVAAAGSCGQPMIAESNNNIILKTNVEVSK